MSVRFNSVFVLSCVQVAALQRADPPSKVSYRPCKKQETEKAAKAQQNGRAIAQAVSRRLPTAAARDRP
jgi:hypothetical protein